MRRYIKLFSIITVIALTITGMTSPFATVNAKGTNRALRQTVDIPKYEGLSVARYQQQKAQTTVSIGSKDKIKFKKNATLSYTIYFPLDMLSTAGAGVNMLAMGDFFTEYSASDGWLASLNSRYGIIIENVDGTVKVTGGYDYQKNKNIAEKSAKKYVSSIKKVGKYYKVMVNNMPYVTKIYDNNGKSKSISKVLKTSKKYYMSTTISFYAGSMQKISKEYVWYDDIIVKQGSRLKYNFSTNNYKWINGYSGGKNNVKPKVANLNTSKVK